MYKRQAPTNGASSYHSGIDIAATEGTPIYACFPGLVTFIGFKGAGGYTITIKNDSITASYCHVSPNYLFKTGDYVTSQSIIEHIGTKYVYNIINLSLIHISYIITNKSQFLSILCSFYQWM